MKKNHIIIFVVLLIIGFASVATTLTMRGTTNVGVNSEDFDVVFIDALLDGKESGNIEIDSTKKKLSFTTDELINVGDKTRLDYRVKNTSTQYNADVLINCTNEENKNIEVNSSFDNKTLPLTSSVNMEAQEIKLGYIEILLTKPSSEDMEIKITCNIEVSATSRENYKYSVSFDSDGGNNISDKAIEWNESYGELEVPEKEGYIFLGWYDEFGNKIDADSLVTIKNHHKLIAKWKTACDYDPGKVWEFNYTGSEQEFTVPCDGEYKLETWGASGMPASSFRTYGAYTSGNILLQKNIDLHIYVGEQGRSFTGTANTRTFNGGGSGNFWCIKAYPSSAQNIAGGGATDIRLVGGGWSDFNSIKSRIMVAGAGGGSTGFAQGGAGGGLTGYNGNPDPRVSSNYAGTGGTQSSGGSSNGLFGFGGIATYSGDWCVTNDGAGGGSGYYGGGGSRGAGAGTAATGAGGSSFISGHNGCNAIAESSTQTNIIHTGGPNHYSGYIFKNTVMIDGNGYNWTTSKGSYTGMPSHDGASTMTGNSGNGFAKITYLGE